MCDMQTQKTTPSLLVDCHKFGMCPNEDKIKVIKSSSSACTRPLKSPLPSDHCVSPNDYCLTPTLVWKPRRFQWSPETELPIISTFVILKDVVPQTTTAKAS